MTSQHDDFQDDINPDSAPAEQTPAEQADPAQTDAGATDAAPADDEARPDGDIPERGKGRGGRKPRDPRRRGGEWGAMPGMQHLHDEHDGEPHGRGHGHPHERHDLGQHGHGACHGPRAGFGPQRHGFGPREHGLGRQRHGFGSHEHEGGGLRDGFGRRGRGRRMDARILRTARTIRRAEHVLGADEVEQTLRESVSHADYVTTVRTLRALSRAVKTRAIEAR